MQKDLRMKNIDRYKSYAKKYYDTNAEMLIQLTNNWRESNKEKFLETQRLWRNNNPEKVKAIRDRCSQKEDQKEKAHLRAKRWQNENRQRVREMSIASEGKRRALRLSTQTELIDIRKVLEKDNNTCQCCNRTNVKMHIDHILPLIKGGTHTYDNLQVLCADCNSSFGGKIKTKELINIVKYNSINKRVNLN